ncbi:CDP-alcohol phosphatidyltransferase-domain-containing protein [Halteromyces radiatus]|uniref:CDP-alcohol phosphatidyltransferase-domain-containing protein n=1 Tax=Halteromyces radiatus TaxID=101107 RepID=UPI002221188B|nr:CDP-alcohol phosphatidyltransferase-domain-containing protein [Halteromyces radiatus]KAI8099516.1 CDP-alcohol phosphatidyltransferase-domain-containing protein [Halteromyces radiatus]
MSIAAQLRQYLDTDFPSQERLEYLRYYKYAAVDKSYITKYFLRHYWNWAIEWFPLWMAPNLITLIGLFFMMFNVLLVYIYAPDLDGMNAPSWIYLSFAIGLWLYSTFDNVDGKQARRTGTSSPLGELFDHGCDALNTTYVAILQIVALGLGQSHLAVILFITTMIGFYLSTAEEYYTGVLYLGIVNGPTEGILLTCAAFLWSWLYGASSWHIPLDTIPSASWLTHWLPARTTGAEIFVWGTVFFFVVTHCTMVFHSMYVACQKKGLHIGQAASESILPIAVFGMAQYYWCMSPYSILLSNEHFFLFTLANGTLFGLMASSIILAHLTCARFPNLLIMISPVIMMAVLVNAPAMIGLQLISGRLELVLLWTELVAYVIIYGAWVILVIDGFCRYLGIRCLVISRTKTLDPSQQDEIINAEEQGIPVDSSQYRTF